MTRNRMLWFGMAALGALWTVPAGAQCGASMAPRSAVAAQALPTLELPASSPLKAALKVSAEARFNEPTMIGLWKVAFVSGGQVVDQAFDAWHGDGTETLVDTPPPSTGNVCLGVWAQTGVLTYKLNHPSWTFDNNGNLNGTAVIKETVTLDANGHAYSGTFTVDVFDLSGKSLSRVVGTVTGQRILVD